MAGVDKGLGSFDAMETHTLPRRREMADSLTFFELHISNLHTSIKKEIQYHHIQANSGSRNNLIEGLEVNTMIGELHLQS